jgi:hypothetical protein
MVWQPNNQSYKRKGDLNMLKFIKGLMDGIKKFFGGIFKKKARPPEQK